MVNVFRYGSSWGDCQAETCRPCCTHCGPHTSSSTLTAPQVFIALFPEKTDSLNVQVLPYTHNVCIWMCVTADPFSCFMESCCCSLCWHPNLKSVIHSVMVECGAYRQYQRFRSISAFSLKHMKFETRKCLLLLASHFGVGEYAKLKNTVYCENLR